MEHWSFRIPPCKIPEPVDSQHVLALPWYSAGNCSQTTPNCLRVAGDHPQQTLGILPTASVRMLSQLGLEKLPGVVGLGKRCFQVSNCLPGVKYGAGMRRGASCAQHRPFLSLLWARSSSLMYKQAEGCPMASALTIQERSLWR